MARNVSRKPKVAKTTPVADQREQILREATQHLISQHGMFLIATDIREAHIRTLSVWIITVTLRYTTGHEGYIGDLLYDGKEFFFLTPPEVRKQRARQIDTDPQRLRKWNDATISSGER
jgi:hypothetical protein